MDDLTSAITLAAITMGLVEAIKIAKIYDNRWLPLTSVVIGFFLTGVSAFFNFTNLTILQGIAVGLAAAGLFDNLKAPVKK